MPAPYSFLARPRRDRQDPASTARNCRSLIQDYHLSRHGRFWPRDSIEQPGLWRDTGTFIELAPTATAEVLRGLPDEAILLAERLLDASGNPMDRTPAAFDDIEDYRLHLHTAIYLRALDDAFFSPQIPRRDTRPGEPAVLHATAAAGCTCLWSLEVFATHYRVVAAKSL